MKTLFYELSAAKAVSFRRLGPQDQAELNAFFVSLDFDQRRSYFGGALSDAAITAFCVAVDWNLTLIVAAGTPTGLQAIACIAYVPPFCATAELSMMCSHHCNAATIGRLFDLVTATTPPYCELIIHRELALPELVRLACMRSIGTMARDEIRIGPRLAPELRVAGALS
jgi:hypothetical protein